MKLGLACIKKVRFQRQMELLQKEAREDGKFRS
jgi:hypothetical protein